MYIYMFWWQFIKNVDSYPATYRPVDSVKWEIDVNQTWNIGIFFLKGFDENFTKALT